MRAVAAQTRVELVLTLRRGENVLVTMAIPVGVLLFFSQVADIAGGLDSLVPSTLALSVVASAFVSLGISTGFERQTGVLKLLGATPLGRSGLLMAKAAATAAVVVVQTAVVAATGLVIGWRPSDGIATAALLVVLGAATFAALSVALAGTVRAETNLAATNAIFVALAAVGGLIVPADSLPAPLAAAARVLPAEPLASALEGALATTGVPAAAVLTLGAWLVAGAAVVATAFKWD